MPGIEDFFFPMSPTKESTHDVTKTYPQHTP